MNRAAILAIVLVIGIGLTDRFGSRPGHEPWVDPRLESAVAEWSRDVRSAGLDPEILLSRLDSITVGNCRRGNLGHATDHWIRIDPKVLDRGDASTRGAVYHELGHAVLDLEHGSGIMAGSIHSQAEYEYYWSVWLEEYLNLGRDAEGI